MSLIKASLLSNLEANYEIQDEVGRGGMGVVYKAVDRRLERPVAIKVLTLGSDDGSDDGLVTEAIERFQREAKVVARLSHPNIVSIYDVGQEGNQYYMIMEFAEGKPLDSLVKGRKALPPDLVTSIGIQICNALGYAHENGIAHRDVKPANIVLSPKGTAKLMDFGIAQLGTEGSKLTQAGSMMGSIMYASPEQVKDVSTVDSRTDIYSLGVTLYELFTGHIPYESESVSQLLLEIMTLSKIPKSMREFNPSIPDQVELIIQRAMQKDLTGRYQQVTEMSKDLSRLMGSHFQAIAGQPLTLDINFDGGSDQATAIRRTGMDSTMMRKTSLNKELIKELEAKQDWIHEAIKDWQRESITILNLPQVINKVMERPLHGQGFSGALLIDENILALSYDGYFVGAINAQTGQAGDEVFRHLPETPQTIELRVLEPGMANAAVILANIVDGTGDIVQKNLDSSLMDLAPLIDNMTGDDEKFTGYIKCYARNNIFYYGFDQGQQIFAIPVNKEPSLGKDTYETLKNLVLQDSVVLNIYACEPNIIGPSIDKLLSQANITVTPTDPDKSTLQTICDKGSKEVPLHLIKEAKQNTQIDLKLEQQAIVEVLGKSLNLNDYIKQSQYFQFAEWMIQEYFYLLNSSGNTTSLKYIYSWIPAIERFAFHETHQGDDKQAHTFTITAHGQVAGEKNKKVLSLIRFGNGQEDSLAQFIDEVTTVKAALIKSGDIGGGIYVANEEFSTETLKLFYSRTVEPRKGFGLGALDALTKYKGFVRMGSRRGYHLNLIEYRKENNSFEVIAPLLK